jgi:hypothetical protein
MVFVSKVDSVNGTEKADWMGAGLSQFFTKKKHQQQPTRVHPRKPPVILKPNQTKSIVFVSSWHAGSREEKESLPPPPFMRRGRLFFFSITTFIDFLFLSLYFPCPFVLHAIAYLCAATTTTIISCASIFHLLLLVLTLFPLPILSNPWLTFTESLIHHIQHCQRLFLHHRCGQCPKNRSWILVYAAIATLIGLHCSIIEQNGIS